MTNLPNDDLKAFPKDKSYIVAGYRLSDIASVDVSKKEFEAFEEITGKPVKKFAEVHSVSIFGKIFSLPGGNPQDDHSDPTLWVKKLFGLNAFFSERPMTENKGLLRFNFRSIVIGMYVIGNGFNSNLVCDPKNGNVTFRGNERICKIPELVKYTYTAKDTFLRSCENIQVKIPDGFAEPGLFLI